MTDRELYSTLPPRVRRFMMVLWTAALAGGVIALTSHERLVVTACLIVVFALVAAIPPIQIPTGGIRAPNLALWTVVAVLWQPGEAGLGVGIGACVGLLLFRRSELWRAANNGSFWGLSVMVASWTAHAIMPQLTHQLNFLTLAASAVGAVISFKVVNEGFVSIWTSRRYARPFFAEWRGAVFRNWQSQLLSAPLSVLVGALDARLGGGVAAGLTLTGVTALTVPLARQELESYYRSKAMLDEIVRAVGVALARVDPGADVHAERVSALAVETGRLLGLPDATLKALELAARLHDVGDIAPAAKLASEAERARMGARILAQFPDPAVAEMIRGHHDTNGTRAARDSRRPIVLRVARHLIPGFAYAAGTTLGTRVLAAAETYESARRGLGEFTAPHSEAESAAILSARADGPLDPAVVWTMLEVVRQRQLQDSVGAP